MAEQKKEDKLVEVVFNAEKIKARIDANRVYGLQVEPDGKGNLVGKCYESHKKALKKAGKID